MTLNDLHTHITVISGCEFCNLEDYDEVRGAFRHAVYRNPETRRKASFLKDGELIPGMVAFAFDWLQIPYPQILKDELALIQ